MYQIERSVVASSNTSARASCLNVKVAEQYPRSDPLLECQGKYFNLVLIKGEYLIPDLFVLVALGLPNYR